MSNRSKSNTNQESVSYLIFFSFSKDRADLDGNGYLITNTSDLKEIIEFVHQEWDQTIKPEHLRVLPFKKSDLKAIKQTLELV